MKALKIVGIILVVLGLGVYLVNKYDLFKLDPVRSHSFKFDRNDYDSPGDAIYDSESGSRMEVFGVDKTGRNLLEGATTLEYKRASIGPDLGHNGYLSWIAHVRIRNLDKEYYDIREDDVFNEGTYTFIALLDEKKIWVSNEGSIDDYEAGESEIQSIKERENQYLNQITYWDGKGEIIFLLPDGWRIHIYDIVINPELPNSIFSPE